jgi:transcriptional regulator
MDMSNKLAVTTTRRAKPLPLPAKKEAVGRRMALSTSPTVKELAQLENENEVVKLRVRGLSYVDIAKRLQVAPATAAEWARSAYKRIYETAEDIENARQLDLERLDAAIAVVMAEMQGDNAEVVNSLAQALTTARAQGVNVSGIDLTKLKGLPNPDMSDKLVKLIAQRTKLLGTEKQPDPTEGTKLQRVYLGFDMTQV